MTTITYLLMAFIVIIATAVTTGDKPSTEPSLCENGAIHSANRLPNNTYRVYRDHHWWEVTGLPGKGQTLGPFPITEKYMAPVTKHTTIMTLVNGSHSGNTFKFEGTYRWEWDAKGQQLVGGAKGWAWDGLPKYGFDCAFNDGHMDDKRFQFPRMIAFQGVHVFYWKTESHNFEPIDDTTNGYVGGHYGEKFPPDLTACMAFKALNKTAKFFVFLFRKDKYCFRPAVGVDGCKTWRDNRELFGCEGHHRSGDGIDTEGYGVGKEGDGSDGSGSPSAGVTPGINYLWLLFVPIIAFMPMF